MCLCETKYHGEVSHPFGELLTSLKKYRAIWGIAAILSPKGPKIETIQDLEKFSSEIEHFKRAAHQTPIFVGILKVRIKTFKRAWNFQARLKTSSESLIFSIFGLLGMDLGLRPEMGEQETLDHQQFTSGVLAKGSLRVAEILRKVCLGGPCLV